MKQVFTPKEFSDFNYEMKTEKMREVSNPRKQTVVLLRQFARSYHVEKSLYPGLSGIVLN